MFSIDIIRYLTFTPLHYLVGKKTNGQQSDYLSCLTTQAGRGLALLPDNEDNKEGVLRHILRMQSVQETWN